MSYQLNQIKKELSAQLFMFPLTFDNSDPSKLKVMVDNHSMFLIEKHRKKGILMSSYTRSKPAIVSAVLITLLNSDLPITIEPDFDYDPEKGVISVNYVPESNPEEIQ